jgi:hemin uptake protein HemP
MKILISHKNHDNEDIRHFTLRVSIERTKDSNNLIGGEQKLVHQTFILEVNGQWTTASKTPMW